MATTVFITPASEKSFFVKISFTVFSVMVRMALLKMLGTRSLNFIRLPVSIIKSCVKPWNWYIYVCTSCGFLQRLRILASISLVKLSFIPYSSFSILLQRVFSASPKRLFCVGTFNVVLNTRRSGSAAKLLIPKSAAITAWKYTRIRVMKSSMPPAFCLSSFFPNKLDKNPIIIKICLQRYKIIDNWQLIIDNFSYICSIKL